MKNLNRKQNHSINGIIAFLFCFFFSSCEQQAIYHQYQAIENLSWEKNREYYFTFQVDDNTIPYDITFEIRNSSLYPYQNLWLFYNEERPIGPMVRDTMECMLADEFGKWYGNGISLFQTSFPVRTNYMFPDKGRYTFSFRQGMRNDTLLGIQEIGLKVEKTALNY